MDKKVMMLIEEGIYSEASMLAEEYSGKYVFDEAEEIFDDIYDRLVDEKGRACEEAVRYMRKLAVVNFNRGNYDVALAHNNAVLEWCSQNNCTDSEFALNTIIDIAKIYSLYNRYEDQYNICRNALDTSINIYGDNDNMTCKLFIMLADSCVELYKYDEAIMYYERVLSIYEADENADAEKIALLYDGIAFVYKYRRMPKKAKEYFEKGLAVLQSKSDEDSETLLLILNDLCSIYSDLSMINEEFELRKSILERAEKLYGFDHPNVCVSKSNLASAYADLGEYDKAIELCENCLRWTREHLGENHRETIRNTTFLSKLYRRIGRYDDALKLARHAYSTRAKLLGDKNIDTVLAHICMAYCYNGLKNFRASKDIFLKAIEFFKDSKEETDYFYAMEGYCAVCILMGEYSEALDGLNKLIKLSETFDEPVFRGGILGAKSRALKGLERFDEALECQGKVIEMFVKKYGESDPDTLIEKVLLADVLFDMGEHKKSAEMLESVISEFDKRGMITPVYYKAKILLARNYSALGEFDKAGGIIGNLLDTMDISIFRAEYSDACYAAAENYRRMLQLDKALEYAEKVVSCRECIYEDGHFQIKQAEKLLEEIKRSGKNETMQGII